MKTTITTLLASAFFAAAVDAAEIVYEPFD